MDRRDERGWGWEVTAAGGEQEGDTAGVSPGLVIPLDQQPSITQASSQHRDPAWLRNWAGDSAAWEIFINIELYTVFGKMNC